MCTMFPVIHITLSPPFGACYSIDTDPPIRIPSYLGLSLIALCAIVTFKKLEGSILFQDTGESFFSKMFSKDTPYVTCEEGI